MGSLKLWFSSLVDPQLERVSFSHELLSRTGTRVSVRGRTVGALAHCTGTFMWSSGVRSMCLLFVQAVLAERHQGESLCDVRFLPHLEGNRLSAASSLDLALSKTPFWLQDIFGLDSRDHPISHRLFRRSNPELKRPGPVFVSLNHEFLPISSVTILVNGAIADSLELRALHRQLTEQFNISPALDGTDIFAHKISSTQDNPATVVHNEESVVLDTWEQIIIESTKDSLAAFECLESHIDEMHEKIYEGYPVVAYAELGRLRDIAFRLRSGQPNRAARAVVKANWMRIRCLSDLTKTHSFRSAVTESEKALTFANRFKCVDSGATYWTNAAIKRLELLARPERARSRKMVTESMQIAERALHLIPVDRPAERLVAHLELAKYALLIRNRRLFEQQTDRADFFGVRLANNSRYLQSLVWDVRARGSLRFDSNFQNAIDNIVLARKELSKHVNGSRHRAIELYIGNTEIQALKTSKDPTHQVHRRHLEGMINLEAMILGNPYQAQRVKQESLTGL